jgi:hypothetical protein
VAGGAVALVLGLEQLEAAPLLRAELGLAAEPAVVLRVEGADLRRPLVGGDGVGHVIEGLARVGEGVLSVDLGEEPGVVQRPQLRGDGLDVRVGHLEGVEGRPLGLLGEGVRPTVPEETPDPQAFLGVAVAGGHERGVGHGLVVPVPVEPGMCAP